MLATQLELLKAEEPRARTSGSTGLGTVETLMLRIALAASTLLFACGQPEAPTPPTWMEPLDWAPVPTGVSEEQTRKGAVLIEAALSRRISGVDLDDVFSFGAVVSRSLPPAASAAERSRESVGMETSERNNPLHRLRAHVDQPGAFLRVRVASRDGMPVARVRIIERSGYPVFADLLFEQTPAGLRVVDVFDSDCGRWRSEVLAEMRRARAIRATSPIYPLEAATAGASVEQMAQMIFDGQYEAALQAYDQLPEGDKLLPRVFELRLAAAEQANGGSGYRVVLEEWLELFLDDPMASLHELEAALIDEDWDLAIESVGFARRLFPDPYWTALEARFEIKRHGYDRAQRLSEQVMVEEPSLIMGPDWALLAALALERDEDAIRYAGILRDRFDVDLAVLAAADGYERLATLAVP